MNLKNIFIIFAVISGILIGVQTSYSFKLDEFLEELDPNKQKSKTEKTEAAPESDSTQKEGEKKAEEQKPGGLLGILGATGVIDKKTSKIIQGGVGVVQGMQPIGFEEEKTIGGSLALEVFQRYGGMYPSQPLQRYITLVGTPLAEVSNRPEIDYHFAVLNTEDPNAFATPGGYVFVSIGLLRLLQNEAQLAGVLGHEIAHISKKHALQTLERSKFLQGVGNLSSAVLSKDGALFDKVINQVSETLFTTGLDKNLEYEADKYGSEFAYRMGYFPAGLRNVMKVLHNAQSGSRSVFMSTHPSYQDRYQRMNQFLSRYKSASLFPVLANRYQSTMRGQM